MIRLALFAALLGSVPALAQSEGDAFEPVLIYEDVEKDAPQDKPRAHFLVGTEGPLFTLQRFGTASIGYRMQPSYSLDFVYTIGRHQEDTYNFKKRTAEGQIYTFAATFMPFHADKEWYVNGLFLRGGPSVQRMEIDECYDKCKKLESQTEDDYLANRQERSWSVATAGLEFSTGFRYQWGRRKQGWMVELQPAIAYFALARLYTRGPDAPSDRSISKDLVDVRYLIWRFGVAF